MSGGVVLTKRSDVPPVRSDRVVIFADLNGNILVKAGTAAPASIGGGSVGITLADVLAAYGARFLPAGGAANQVLSKIDGTDYNVTWVAQTGGGGGGSVAWGAITGTLSNQTDLNNSLAGKAASSHTHTISDLSGVAATSHTHTISDLSGVAAAGHDQTQTLASGSYTPTLTSVANVSSSTAALCIYMRVGNTTVVHGKVAVTDSSQGVETKVGISLPIASNIGAATDLAGVTVVENLGGDAGFLLGDAANDRAELRYVAAASGSSADHYFTFSYRML